MIFSWVLSFPVKFIKMIERVLIEFYHHSITGEKLSV